MKMPRSTAQLGLATRSTQVVEPAIIEGGRG
jgi:hypothetical protein